VLGVLWLIALLCGGCDEHRRSSGQFVSDMKSYLPLFKKETDYTYRLDGTRVEATYEIKGRETTPILELIAHDKVFEREVYQIDETEIFLVETLGETYEKPIRLLKFPFYVGEESEWEGTMKTEGEILACKAKITTSEDRVQGIDRTMDAIQVTVLLSIRQADITVDKKLAFWFVPNEGIVKREFGVSQRTIEK
jgi:hypothetical protein